ncbi:hypothetical protein ACF0H5_018584 [Mactra antiquata]
MAFSLKPLNLKRHLFGTGLAVVGWMTYSYLPKTYGAKFFKTTVLESLPFCKKAESDPVTKSLINEVIQDINCHQEVPVRRKGIELFQTNALLLQDVTFIGSSRTGAVIALPIGVRSNAHEVFHYHCTIENSIDMATFCILSQAGKKFLIAREIMYCEDNFLLFRSFVGIAFIGVFSVLMYMINSLLSLRQQLQFSKLQAKINQQDILKLFITESSILNRRKSTIAGAVLLVVCSVFYKLIIAAYSVQSETDIHNKLANLGPEYITGGKELYEKMILSNKYQYSMFGDQGYYTKTGEFTQGKYSIFHQTLPLSEKLGFFLNLDKSQVESSAVSSST